jgi:hypothetical protein
MAAFAAVGARYSRASVRMRAFMAANGTYTALVRMGTCHAAAAGADAVLPGMITSYLATYTGTV